MPGMWFRTSHLTLWFAYHYTRADACYIAAHGDRRYRVAPPKRHDTINFNDARLRDLIYDLVAGIAVQGILADYLTDNYADGLHTRWGWLDLPQHLRVYDLVSLYDGTTRHRPVHPKEEY